MDGVTARNAASIWNPLCIQEHIDMYMAGALRRANSSAARDAALRARSTSSLKGSNGESLDGEDDEPVDGETDLEEFRRWLAMPRAEAVAAVPSQPEAVADVPSQPEAVAAVAPAVPSQPEALVSVPSEPEALAVPSQPEALVAVPSQPEACVPSLAASTGLKAPSNTKQSAEAELPSRAKATQPMLNRSRVMESAASDTGAACARKGQESTWHVPGNCEKCFKHPDQCNSMACVLD